MEARPFEWIDLRRDGRTLDGLMGGAAERVFSPVEMDDAVRRWLRRYGWDGVTPIRFIRSGPSSLRVEEAQARQPRINGLAHGVLIRMAMRADQFRRIRAYLHMSAKVLALQLNIIPDKIQGWESGTEEVPEAIALVMQLLQRQKSQSRRAS